jgi:hypothetical protein
MCWLDNHHIATLYPDLLARKVALEGFYKQSTTFIGYDENRDVHVYRNNMLFLGPCGNSCPSKVRCSYDRDGVAEFHWNLHADPDTKVDFMAYSRNYGPLVKWKLGKGCYNHDCPDREYWA